MTRVTRVGSRRVYYYKLSILPWLFDASDTFENTEILSYKGFWKIKIFEDENFENTLII